MGIPIDGDVNSFCEMLQERGFVKDENAPDSMYSYVGKFYGEDAYINVEYDPYTHVTCSVSVSFVHKISLSLITLQRNILKAIEEKYTYKKQLVNQELRQYDYYIFDALDPIGLIQTFLIEMDPPKESMLSISYTDVENYLKMENRKSEDL